jgi:hypothetical protein
MSLVRKLLNQVRNPTGWFGRWQLRGMNRRHSKLTDWGLGHISIGGDATILDIGCGGGRTIHKLAAPNRKVFGVDHSETSVASSQKQISSGSGAGRQRHRPARFLKRAYLVRMARPILSQRRRQFGGLFRLKGLAHRLGPACSGRAGLTRAEQRLEGAPRHREQFGQFRVRPAHGGLDGRYVAGAGQSSGELRGRVQWLGECFVPSLPGIGWLGRVLANKARCAFWGPRDLSRQFRPVSPCLRTLS